MALAIALASAAIFAALAPFATLPLTPLPAFIPVYQSALIVGDLVTATLLFGQFHVLRSRALVVLASAYLFSAAMAIAHLASFPGLFAPGGLLGTGPQTTAWLYFLWHAGFPLLVVLYALLQDGERASPAGMQAAPARGSSAAIATSVGAVLAATAALTALATAGHDALPVVMRGDSDAAAKIYVASGCWAFSLLALVVLWRRRPHAVLDLWLMVTLCIWIFDIALAAVLNAGRYDLGWYSGRVYGFVAANVVLMVLLIENSLLYARLNRANVQLEDRVAERTVELQRSREELHEIASASAAAREHEKTRLARELHDELAQALTALKMDLAWLGQSGAAADAEASARLAEMDRILDDTVAVTRRISADLRPLLLDDLGIVAAAEWLVGAFSQRHGIQCSLAVDPPELELPDKHATALFRILQESLTNVARHAGASRVEIELGRGADGLRLRVRDNGRGFDPTSPRKTTSFGLVGLRERAYLVEGRLRIDSAPGRGTTIEVWVPMPSE